MITRRVARGLAENAVLPAKLAELTASVADILEAHMPALDLTDERSRREYEVYRRLAGDHRQAGLRAPHRRFVIASVLGSFGAAVLLFGVALLLP